MNFSSWLWAQARFYRRFYGMCRAGQTALLPALCRYYWRRRHGVRLVAHARTELRGLRNLTTHGTLRVGLRYIGFTSPHDRTLLNLGGRLITHEDVDIGKGCRLDIGPGGVVEIGAGTYLNPFCTLIIMHSLSIGSRCAIAWEVQMLDEDFHEIDYPGRRPAGPASISIGDRVWIGSRVSIYKGTVIPSGCVVASNSVVKGVFTEENVLIAGNPARVVRQQVSWNS